MKHLIRNTKSLHFFDHGRWTADARHAQTFETSEAARETSACCGLSNTEFVIDSSQTVEVTSADATISIAN